MSTREHGSESSPIGQTIQLHVAHNSWPGEFKANQVAKMHPFSQVKPGGFWTSTETEQWTSAWTRLCQTTLIEREGIRWPPATMIRLVETQSPRLLLVRDDYDLVRIFERFGSEALVEVSKEWLGSDHLRDGLRDRFLDLLAEGLLWSDVARTVDAIHFTAAPANKDANLVLDWECESTVWFRPHLHLKIIEQREIAGTITESEPPGETQEAPKIHF